MSIRNYLGFDQCMFFKILSEDGVVTANTFL